MNIAPIDDVRHDTDNQKQPWQTPALRRSDASDAEATPGPGMDSGITTS
jgi:hypothetical protein